VDDIHLKERASLSPTIRNRTMRGTAKSYGTNTFTTLKTTAQAVTDETLLDIALMSTYNIMQVDSNNISVWKKLIL
jgi:hypothetical protein